MATEGKQIAEILVPRGIAAIVVKYRLPNGHHLIPANDARRAMRTVRQKSAEWRIQPNKVGVWGFSAGGHLASTVATVFDKGRADAADPIDRHSSRPDFAILFYPVVSMEDGVTHGGSRNNLLGPNAAPELVQKYSNDKRVGPMTPPTFLLHCADDRAVPVENSVRFYRGLIRSGVPAQMLLFEKGSHGPNAFRTNPSWLPAFEKWLNQRGCL
jgi:acetyl esterase/lipase